MEKEKEKDLKDQQGKKPTKKPYNKKPNPGKFTSGQGTPISNPWDLYASSESIAKDVANIPFNHISGTPFKWYNGSVASTGTWPHDRLTGICVLSYIPTPGGASLDATSSINMAARQLYSYVRRANSGAKNYESPDLLLYILAMEDIYINFYEAKRAYGFMANYQYMNRYTPDSVVRAVGIDPDDLRANLAQYRYQLNQLRLKINSLAVPKYFKSFIRRVVVASQIYCDSTSPRSGYYVYAKQGYYTFNPTKYATGGALIYTHTSPSTVVTLQSKLDIIKSQIEAIIADDDMNTMMGDLIKAFGESGLYNVSEVTENYSVVPVYDENVLAQIENSRAWKVFWQNIADEAGTEHGGLDIWQKSNVLFYHPCVDLTSGGDSEVRYNRFGLDVSPIINSHKDNPDYKDILEWTRQLAVHSGKLFKDNKVIDCGLEIVTGYSFVSPNITNTGVTVQRCGSFLVFSSDDSSYYSKYIVIKLLATISQYDWHPFLFTAEENTGAITDDGLNISGDLKVFNTVDATIISRIHQCANYSVYYDPNLY